MKNVFVYGSLMFDDVWERVVKRHYEKQAAVLRGYRRLPVKGESYPGLVKSFSGYVQGLVYFDVTAQGIRRLDKFEGSYYRRRQVRVKTADGRVHNASVYVFNRRYRRLLGSTSWDPQHFEMLYLSRFIRKYKSA
jgi:gamma-glutamylcyclotransferase (GGCT)/AIG2-like uncharacterized protein YtfP